MNTSLSLKVVANYSSLNQRIRVMWEGWVNQSKFCPNCGVQFLAYILKDSSKEISCQVTRAYWAEIPEFFSLGVI
ncbi:MAG: hypothetical protein HND47_23460 [Chloroflexi bacterium]|nr:hypothetical protein [Chloroflexota bacterium]